MKLSKLFIFSFIFLISFSLISALSVNIPDSTKTETYKANEDIELKFTCILNNSIPSGAEFNITISYPNGITFINNQNTTALGNGAFSYTTAFIQTGLYKVQMFCYDGTSSYSGEGYYDITSTGIIQTSIFNNPLFLILGVFGLCLIILGAFKGIPWFGFIGSIMFLLLGIYTMIYGFNNITDLYTRGVAITFIGVGLIFMFSAAYEWLESGETETIAEEAED